MNVPEIEGRMRDLMGDPTLLTRDDVQCAVREAIQLLDGGELRVATPPTTLDGDWVVNAWVKQAILGYFRLQGVKTMEAGPLQWCDKIPVKTGFKALGVRVVPPAVARVGSFISRGAILMPSYVNIGARVGAGSMVDTWATVGSCAQIGAGVHLSGGVGIGGVLEPPNAQPVIVEDGAFIGSRCIVVEGVRVGREAVLGAGTVITQSTHIIDVREGANSNVLKGAIPPRAVVIPGTRERGFPGGLAHIPCAYIIGDRRESTDRKTSLNDALRTFAVAV